MLTCHYRTHGAVTGEPVDGKSGTAGSGRGPLEKDLISGTSPAAYRYRTSRAAWAVADLAGHDLDCGYDLWDVRLEWRLCILPPLRSACRALLPAASYGSSGRSTVVRSVRGLSDATACASGSARRAQRVHRAGERPTGVGATRPGVVPSRRPSRRSRARDRGRRAGR